MQSPVAIVLRVGLLIGCLGFLPLVAAGGLLAPAKLIALAQSWQHQPSGLDSLLVPHNVQVELPTDELPYREVGFPVESSWDETAGLEVAEIMPARYEGTLPPPREDEIPGESSQPWSVPTVDSAADRKSEVEEVFEPGNRTEAAATVTLAEVENRLRAMGATEIRVEPWGSSGQLYRFCAGIPVAGSAEVQRYFQSIGPSPDQAALDVLTQVTDFAR